MTETKRIVIETIDLLLHRMEIEDIHAQFQEWEGPISIKLFERVHKLVRGDVGVIVRYCDELLNDFEKGEIAMNIYIDYEDDFLELEKKYESDLLINKIFQ